MIHRFLQDASGHPSTNARAYQLLQETAETLGAESHELDHAIWRYQSTQAQRRRLLAANTLPAWHDTKRRLGAADRHVRVVNHAHHVLSWGLAARRGT
jgi:hypothetical protein